MHELFEEIMAEIKSGLTEDTQHNIKHLNATAEKYKEHPLGAEIAKECGRIMFSLMSQEEQNEFNAAHIEDYERYHRLIGVALADWRKGECNQALETIQILAREFDTITKKSYFSDSKTVYYVIDDVLDAILLVHQLNDGRSIKGVDLPLSFVYFLEGFILFELGRLDEAYEAYRKAEKWAPTDVKPKFEMAEICKLNDDWAQYKKHIRSAFPFIITTEGLARYYRANGFYYIAQEEYELAAALFLLSRDYADSPIVENELKYIEKVSGADYSNLSTNRVLEVAKKNKFSGGAHPGVHEALFASISEGIEKEDYELTYVAASALYGLTGNEETLKVVELAQAMLDGKEDEDPEEG